MDYDKDNHPGGSYWMLMDLSDDDTQMQDSIDNLTDIISKVKIKKTVTFSDKPKN